MPAFTPLPSQIPTNSLSSINIATSPPSYLNGINIVSDITDCIRYTKHLPTHNSNPSLLANHSPNNPTMCQYARPTRWLCGCSDDGPFMIRYCARLEDKIERDSPPIIECPPTTEDKMPELEPELCGMPTINECVKRSERHHAKLKQLIQEDNGPPKVGDKRDREDEKKIDDVAL